MIRGLLDQFGERRSNQNGSIQGAMTAPPPWSAASAQTYSGTHVDAERALSHSAVWACVWLLVDLISTLPWQAFTNDAKGLPQLEKDLPQFLKTPAPDTTWMEYVGQMIYSAALRGNFFAYVAERDGFGRPSLSIPLNPDNVVAVRVGARGPVVAWRVGTEMVPPEDMLHFRINVPAGGVLGLSPIAYGAQAIGLGLATERFGAGFFGEGAHPSGVLQSEQVIDQPTAEGILSRFRAATSTRKPVVLGAGLEWKPIQVSPNESQFLETIKANDATVARFYRVPPEMIGGQSGSNMTYANIEQRFLNLNVLTINPWVLRSEQWVSDILAPPIYVRADTDVLARTDLITRYRGHDYALRDGWRSRNEIRAIEKLAPIAGGDDYLWPPYRAFPIESDAKE